MCGLYVLVARIIVLVLALAKVFLSYIVKSAARLALYLGIVVDNSIFHRVIAKSFSRFGLLPLILSLGARAILVFQGWYLAQRGYKLYFTPSQILFIVATLNINSLIPLTIAGLGSNDALLLMLAREFLHTSYQPEKLIAFSLSLSLLNMVFIIIICGITFITSHLGQLRRPQRGITNKVD